MRRIDRLRSFMALGVALGCLLAPGALARSDSGDLLGTVADAEGHRLAGVEVVLTGVGEPLRQTSDADGVFRFRALKPGNYTLEVSQDGYSKARHEPVNVRLGRTTTVKVQMSPTLAETIIVTSEPPRAASTADAGHRVLDAGELDEIPLAADPWSVHRQAGVLSDRATPAGVGGGEPAAVVGPGAHPRDNVYILDGADVTDRGKPSRLSTTYDLGAAARVRVGSGGADPSVATPGVVFDLTTKNAGNRASGGLRAAVSDRSWQSDPSIDGVGLTDDLSQPAANRVLDVGELGADGGGALLRDHLWLWGSHLQQEIRRQAVGGTVEDTRLGHSTAKLSSQLGRSSAVVSYHRGEKDRSGSGAGLDRSLESTLAESEPSHVLRLEDNLLLRADWHLTARYTEIESSTDLTPLGAADADIALAADGIWQGSYGDFRYAQDSASWALEGAHYHSGGSQHEVRFGINQRDATYTTSERWGRDSLLHLAGENFGTPYDIVRLVRPTDLAVEQDHFSFWIQDSIVAGRLRVDLGLRHDLQQGRTAAGMAGANPLFPDLLPAQVDDGSPALEWNTVQPRFGVAYALDRRSRTVLRGSFGFFASQLYADLASRVSPVSEAAVYLGFEDSNHDDRFDLTGDPYFLLTAQGIDPGTAAASPRVNDPALTPEQTRELRLGIEHSFGTSQVLAVSYVSRRVSDIFETRRQIRDEAGQVRLATVYDYRLDTLFSSLLPDGEPFAVPIYSLAPGLEYTGGSLLANGDRTQSYEAATLAYTKRMSNRWTLRGHLRLSDWRWQLGPHFQLFDDPTDLATGASTDAGVSQADNQGDVVAEQLEGAGQLMSSRWSFNLFALYQLAPEKPWGFDLAMNVHGREGFPVPYTVAAVGGDGDLRQVQATPATDSYRLDDVVTVDLRLEKELRLGKVRTILSLDGLNVANEGVVLEREGQLNGPLAGQARHTLSPRVLRLGVRLVFN